MKILVGSTGFVGSNLASQLQFDGLFHSTDIAEAYGTSPELLVYAGVRAEKYLANNDPKADVRAIEDAFDNIRKIKPKQLVLISTVDVYKKPRNADEDDEIKTHGLHYYGLHRNYLERLVSDILRNSLTVRLPALFGRGLKKNFIYDIINVIPSMLSESAFERVRNEDSTAAEHYQKQDNGFYKLEALTEAERESLKQRFLNISFNAVNFTDSRAVFQFYNISRLWKDILIALENNIKLINMVTEPVSASTVYAMTRGENFENILSSEPPWYDLKTKYDVLYGGQNGYIYGKAQVMEELKAFIGEEI